MTDILQIFNMILTAVPGIVIFGVYRKAGYAKACVLGMGFFVVGFYVDTLFSMIMSGFAGGDRLVLMQVLGMLISKCVEYTALAGMLVFAKEQNGSMGKNAVWETKAGSIGGRNFTESVKPVWSYPDALTLVITLFFWLLGIYVRRWDENAFEERIAILLGLLGLLATYYISLYIHLKKQNAKVSRAHEESAKHEAHVYLEQVENNYQRTRELWHDLKNHINLMHLLLQDGKYEELEAYLKHFNEDVDSLTLPAKSGNLIVDALLADKLARAKREKIEVSLELCDLSGLKLQPDEICGMLGNLLDNAIEANRHLREGRKLEVTCRNLEECYYIRVRNPVNGTEKEATKTDYRNRVGHGLGLRSVERIAHGCGGEVVADRSEKHFTVVVRIPG